MNDVPVLPAIVHSERSESDRRMFGLLREIRAACQYLQGRIDELLPALQNLPAQQWAVYIKTSLSTALLTRVQEKVEGSLRAIADLFSTDASEFEWCADQVTLIDLYWSQSKDSVLEASASPEHMEVPLQQIANGLDKIIFICASLTLSPRINDVMKNLRIGQPLDVEFEFGDEFPTDPSLRKRLIEELAQQSAVIQYGVVDVQDGVIYKAAPSRQGQLNSLWRLFAWLLAGILMPVILAEAGRGLTNWPFSMADIRWLLEDYVLILVGSGAHLAIEALKTARANKHPSFQAVNDWILWVHVREAQIVKGILYIFLGYLFLIFGVHPLNWTSAFFAGYSIDSVTEVFLERFATTVSTRTKELTRAVA